ncbi:MAG TPA: hypothetical protein VI299_27965 [Polyangiales bacterium]
MSTSATEHSSRDTLGKLLRERLAHARAHAQHSRERARRLEAELQAARQVERAARENLHALEAIAAEAAELIGGPIDEDSLPVGAVRSVDDDRRPDVEQLAGARLREMTVRVALRRGAHREPSHWRQWLEWFREAGFDAVGKKPEATFLTQLARSPLVRRTASEGIYALDLGAVNEERRKLVELHERLGGLPAPGQTSLLDGLDDIRKRRRALEIEVARSERRLREMLNVLGQEPPPGFGPDADKAPEDAISAWLRAFGQLTTGADQLRLD